MGIRQMPQINVIFFSGNFCAAVFLQISTQNSGFSSLVPRWTEFNRQQKMTRDQGEDLVKKMSPFVLKKFQDGCDVVILGHSHLPQKTIYNINGRSKKFITLGDWIYHYSFLYYDDEDVLS